MSYKKLTVKQSSIAGHGLYTDELIKKGELIMFWMADAHLIKETDYNLKQSLGDIQMISTGARYVGDIFLYTDVGPKKNRYENYINHSFNPNVLYHCGICFALRDIQPLEELTTDYTYLLSESDQESFVDEASNKVVRGVSWQQCLMQTTKQLINLVSDLQNCNLEKNEIKLYTKDIDMSPDSPQSTNSGESSDRSKSITDFSQSEEPEFFQCSDL